MSKWGRLLGWAGLMLVLGLTPLVIGWSNLPDPVATHWGFDGQANGNMRLAFVPLIQVGIVAVGLFTTSMFRVEGEPTPEAFAMLGLLGGLGTALNISLVQLNWGVETWTDAGEFSLWHLGGVLLAALLGGMAGYALGRHWYPERHPVAADGPAVDVALGERVSWVGRATVRWPIFMLGGAAFLFVMIPDWGPLAGPSLRRARSALPPGRGECQQRRLENPARWHPGQALPDRRDPVGPIDRSGAGRLGRLGMEDRAQRCRNRAPTR